MLTRVNSIIKRTMGEYWIVDRYQPMVITSTLYLLCDDFVCIDSTQLKSWKSTVYIYIRKCEKQRLVTVNIVLIPQHNSSLTTETILKYTYRMIFWRLGGQDSMWQNYRDRLFDVLPYRYLPGKV